MSGHGQPAPMQGSSILGVPYICGNCGSEVPLKPGDVIQCRWVIIVICVAVCLDLSFEN